MGLYRRITITMNHKLLTFKGLQSIKSPGVWIARVSGYSQANPHLWYTSRVSFGPTEGGRGLPVEYLSITIQFTIPMHPPGWKPCGKRPHPWLRPASCWEQWYQWDRTQAQRVRGASGFLGHSTPGKQGNGQDRYFLTDLHLIIGALGFENLVFVHVLEEERSLST